MLLMLHTTVYRHTQIGTDVRIDQASGVVHSVEERWFKYKR